MFKFTIGAKNAPGAGTEGIYDWFELYPARYTILEAEAGSLPVPINAVQNTLMLAQDYLPEINVARFPIAARIVEDWLLFPQ